MKNKKKLIRKNRTILYVTIALALVSLMSVGFSNYIIGLENKSKDITTNISTETITYKTLILEASTNTKNITADRNNNSSTTGGSTTNPHESIRSPYTYSNKYRNNNVSLLKEGDNTTSLVATIPFNIDIIASYNPDDTTNVIDLRPDSLDVSYKIIDSKDTTNTTNLNNITTSGSKFRSNGDYNLFNFNITTGGFSNDRYTFDKDTDFEPYTTSSGTTLTGSYYHCNKKINIDIKYGSFFNYELPDDFYNKKLEDIKNEYLANNKTKDYLLESIDEAYTELLNSFYERINNKSIVFTFKVNKAGIT
ncbi:MAG: hypothetical protein MR606_00410 [Mollicutes bacterium]|nr:hypothetical protein [Mollicutes bacterium]MDD7263743.1 hypothetical protein [bacterium]MDY4979801.1 hypothetical protein [Candidatus Onthovivens sp.]